VEQLSRRDIERSDFMLNRSGSHRDEGIFIIVGNKVNTETSMDKAEITDIAPTILYLLGIPIQGEMDGKILLDCFRKDHLEEPTYENAARSEAESDYHYTDAETDEIKKRLEGLGYL
jgi:hypothetical protein